MKKITAFLLICILLLGAIPFTVSAEEAVIAQTGASGTFGDLSWNFASGTGHLYIYGTGEMPDCDFDAFKRVYVPPWYDYRNSIKSVTIGSNVLSIGEGAFCGCTKLETAVIGTYVKKIGKRAFEKTALKAVDIPERIRMISTKAFYGCSSLTTVNFLGNKLQVLSVDSFTNTALTSIKLPQSIQGIDPYSFGYRYNESSGSYQAVLNFTLYGFIDTASEYYAEDNPNIKFVALCEGTISIDQSNIKVGDRLTYTLGGYAASIEYAMQSAVWQRSKTGIGGWENVVGLKQHIVTQEDAGCYIRVTFTGHYIRNSRVYDMEGELISNMVKVNEYRTYKSTVRVTSFLNASDPVTVSVYKNGASSPFASKTASGNSASIVFEDLPAGTYTVKTSKKNHVTRESSLVIISTDAYSFVEVHPIGDVNGDGKVNTRDMMSANAHMKGTLLTGYAYDCANVVKDSVINIRDLMAMNGHTKGKSLWK